MNAAVLWLVVLTVNSTVYPTANLIDNGVRRIDIMKEGHTSDCRTDLDG